MTAILKTSKSADISFRVDLTDLGDAELVHAASTVDSITSTVEVSVREAFRSLHDLAQIYHAQSVDEGIIRNIFIPLSHFGGRSLTRSCVPRNALSRTTLIKVTSSMNPILTPIGTILFTDNVDSLCSVNDS